MSIEKQVTHLLSGEFTGCCQRYYVVKIRNIQTEYNNARVLTIIAAESCVNENSEEYEALKNA